MNSDFKFLIKGEQVAVAILCIQILSPNRYALSGCSCGFMSQLDRAEVLVNGF